MANDPEAFDVTPEHLERWTDWLANIAKNIDDSDEKTEAAAEAAMMLWTAASLMQEKLQSLTGKIPKGSA